MQAGRSIRFPASSIIPQLMVQENAGVSSTEGSISSHFNISMNFLCLTTRLGLLAKTFVRALIARLKASQLDADAVEPNTIVVARLYNLSAMKPKAQVESAWILVYLKHALTSAGPRRIVAVG
jgi:hypothetical protein